MTTNRITFIDALRGFSLLGILLANLLSFQYGITGTIQTKDLSALDNGVGYFVNISVGDRLLCGAFLPNEVQ